MELSVFDTFSEMFHPNIVMFLGMKDCPDNGKGIVTEYLEGGR